MDLPVVIGIDRAGLVGDDGETHHGVFDIGFLSPIPNIILSQPRNAEEARNLLYTAFRQSHPFFIRFPKGIQKDPENRQFREITVGTWEMINEADTNKTVLLTYGDTVDAVLEKVHANDLPITVVNCRFFKPLDEKMLDRIAASGKKIAVYETDMLTGGLGSLILDYYNRKNMNVNLRRFGLGDQYIHQGSIGQLRRENGIDLNSVLEASLED
jgi:1-deoxy-D-xylulose-5-phosphate synthase